MTKMKKPKWPFVAGSLLGGGVAYFVNQKLGAGKSTPYGSSYTPPSSRAGSSSSTDGSPIRSTTATNPGGTHKRDNPNPDDLTLRDRVETEIFKNPETSREHININVVNGIVEIRGEQPSQGAIDTVVKQVKDIPDVKGVHNYLHMPGTPAPNKESAIEAE